MLTPSTVVWPPAVGNSEPVDEAVDLVDVEAGVGDGRAGGVDGDAPRAAGRRAARSGSARSRRSATWLRAANRSAHARRPARTAGTATPGASVLERDRRRGRRGAAARRDRRGAARSGAGRAARRARRRRARTARRRRSRAGTTGGRPSTTARCPAAHRLELELGVGACAVRAHDVGRDRELPQREQRADGEHVPRRRPRTAPTARRAPAPVARGHGMTPLLLQRADVVPVWPSSSRTASVCSPCSGARRSSGGRSSNCTGTRGSR